MPKGSEELTNRRREEIISACAKLYETMNFRDITIKEIGGVTSFTRTSIYNYFQTKEEIFLALLQREYEWWVLDLTDLMALRETLSAEELARELARSLEKRERLLKLMSMNHYDMEANSRPEALTAFKRAYGASLRAVEACLKKYRPDMTDAERRDFLYVFFPFVYGIYPYAVVTDKQREAMRDADVPFAYHTIFDLAYACVLHLLNAHH